MSVRVAIAKLTVGEHVLEREAAHYLVTVHRLRAGDRFLAFDPESATESDAVLVEAGARRVVCRLEAPRRAELLPSFSLTLVQALAKGDKPEQVVRAATALGVSEVLLVIAERSVVRPAQERSRLERLRAIALDAARQSGRGDVPRLEGPRSVDEVFDEWRGRSGRKLCLEPSAATSLLTALDGWQAEEPVALLVGPEGGWSERELGSAEAAGFIPVRLGRLTLRAELAGIAALGAILGVADENSR